MPCSSNMPDEPKNNLAEDKDKALTPEGQREIRERVTRLVFDGDGALYKEFVDALGNATPDGAWVILRGSAITGHKWMSDQPFDGDGPGTSDMDVTFVGGDMVMLFNEFHIPGIHSVPFGEDHPFAAPALGDLRERLCRMARRQVNIQATTSLVQSVRDATMDQPYLVMVDKRDVKNAEAPHK